ncbi:MAG: DMT family transporter [Duncaniella sp.]|nr:DMT family transporter [Duncaniella sp.]
MNAATVNIGAGRPALVSNILVLLTVAMWGLTFVSTKVLITHGLTPTWIFISRFAMAYLCILALSHKKLWSDTRKDELYMAAMGLTGGSLYFISENTALQLTYASNVSLIICAAPVLTMILGAVLYKDRIRIKAVVGSLIALCGVSAVILNGSMNLGLNPAGDLLTLFAALLWAAYCLLLKRMTSRYPNLFVTRKIFFYGCASALLVSVFEPLPRLPEAGSLMPVVLNLLFLGIVASFLCYIIWNREVKILGPEKAANYIYFIPLVTIVASSLILGEPITLWMIAGGLAIVGGVYLTAK